MLVSTTFFDWAVYDADGQRVNGILPFSEYKMLHPQELAMKLLEHFHGTPLSCSIKGPLAGTADVALAVFDTLQNLLITNFAPVSQAGISDLGAFHITKKYTKTVDAHTFEFCVRLPVQNSTEKILFDEHATKVVGSFGVPHVWSSTQTLEKLALAAWKDITHTKLLKGLRSLTITAEGGESAVLDWSDVLEMTYKALGILEQTQNEPTLV